ncbi:MAG: NADH-quinone oxidoreductase subunit L [Pirellulaceae bacterium]|nr:NADH-quinone oxidoreductase subunit L [Pirellulaceae bacterium]
MDYIAWLIPLGPLVAAVIGSVIAYLNPRASSAHLVTWIGLTVSACASLLCLMRIEVTPGLIVGGYSWLDFANMRVPISLQLDATSLVQICVVTVVGTLVSYYSAGYMHGDKAYARFFAIFSAFVFCMTMLVLADNLLVLYMFWEGVGLCSYLMIGFWYERPSAAKAALKAFTINRLADTGFLFGILLLWLGIGQVTTAESGIISRLDYKVIFDALPALAAAHPDLLFMVAAMLLLGAVGKSAQFPLHIWLPDAMEGPTPVSALIHAATMVTAGVYLMCRMSPLLVLAPGVLVFAGWLGAITALLAASVALFQDDLKRVLAYSTVSQLGYMFMGISCGASNNLMSLAVMAALFHVATHAFFKALLFLSAGNVMHAMGDVIDMRKFSGLKGVLPKTHLLFLIGGAALAGIPLLSGFWSKDGILGLLISAQAEDSPYAFSFQVFFVVGLITAGLTAVYTSRAYWHTFQGKEVFPKEAGDHPHEATTPMLVPLAVLAVGSVVLGLAIGPTGILEGYLHEIPHLPVVEHAEHHTWVLIASAAVALAGVVVGCLSAKQAWTFRSAGAVGQSFSSAGKSRFYMDEMMAGMFVRPLEFISARLSELDLQGIDGLWRNIVELPKKAGWAFSFMQRGQLGGYSLLMAVGLVAYLLLLSFGK